MACGAVPFICGAFQMPSREVAGGDPQRRVLMDSLGSQSNVSIVVRAPRRFLAQLVVGYDRYRSSGRSSNSEGVTARRRVCVYIKWADHGIPTESRTVESIA